MRKRVFGSIFLTSLVTLLLTTGLLLLAVHAGLTNDMRRRLVTESSYLSAWITSGRSWRSSARYMPTV